MQNQIRRDQGLTLPLTVFNSKMKSAEINVLVTSCPDKEFLFDYSESRSLDTKMQQIVMR